MLVRSVAEVKQALYGVQQTVRCAGFGFVLQRFQRWVQQLVHDAVNRLFDGSSLSFAEVRVLTVQDLQLAATDFTNLLTQSLNNRPRRAVIDFMHEALRLLLNDLSRLFDFRLSQLAVFFTVSFEPINVDQEHVFVNLRNGRCEVPRSPEVHNNDRFAFG